MKKLLIIVLTALALNLAAQQTRRYEFKSMVVNYTIQSSGMGSTTFGSRLLRIDDYGIKESREEEATTTTKGFGKTSTEKKHTLDILNGDFGYSIDLITREGTKSNIGEFAGKFAPAGMAMAGDLEKYKGKEGMKRFVEENGGTWHGDEIFMTKNCWVFTVLGVKMWMYKGLVLKSESTAWGMNITETATSVDENASIPANAFEVPSGIHISEISGQGLLNGIPGFDNPGDTPPQPAPGLPYPRFKQVTTGLNIPGYTFYLTDDSDNLYLTTYVKSETDQVLLMMENEPRFYEMAQGGNGIFVENNYLFNGHEAVYLRITREDDGTPTDARMLLYHLPEYKSVFYIITGIPFTQQKLEQIISQIKF